jgi:hypothetical protein
MTDSRTSRAWLYASLAFAAAAILALVLLWGAGPLMPGAGAPSQSTWIWAPPGWLVVASVVTLLIAFPAAIICAFVVIKQRSQRPFSSSPFWWVASILLLIILLSSIG